VRYITQEELQIQFYPRIFWECVAIDALSLYPTWILSSFLVTDSVVGYTGSHTHTIDLILAHVTIPKKNLEVILLSSLIVMIKIQLGLVLCWSYILKYLDVNRIVIKCVLFKWLKLR